MAFYSKVRGGGEGVYYALTAERKYIIQKNCFASKCLFKFHFPLVLPSVKKKNRETAIYTP